MSQAEYESILKTMNEGFSGVHGRIDSFSAEFSNHRLACARLFEEIHVAEAVRKGTEKGVQSELVKRINWGKVKTAVAIAIATLLSVAAIKIIFTNIGKFTW